MNRIRVAERETIELGRVGENKAREIVFDIARWKKLYGAGAVRLMVRRAGENVMYPVELRQEGDEAIWLVTDTDAAIAGGGECELSYLGADGTVAKSVIYGTYVLPAMRWESSEAPDAVQPWLHEIRTLAEEMREAVSYLWNGAVDAADAGYCIEFGTLEYHSDMTQELTFNFSQSYRNAPVFIPYVENEEVRIRVEAMRSQRGYYGGKVTVINTSGENIAATVAVSAYCSLPVGDA